MRYYGSKKELVDDVEPLIELEPQLILNEELFIDYIIVKLNYLSVFNKISEIKCLVNLLSEYKNCMSSTNKLNYLKILVSVKKYDIESIDQETKDIEVILSACSYDKNLGCFYITQALN